MAQPTIWYAGWGKWRVTSEERKKDSPQRRRVRREGGRAREGGIVIALGRTGPPLPIFSQEIQGKDLGEGCASVGKKGVSGSGKWRVTSGRDRNSKA